jgi:nitric oxide dioxygenase
MNSKQKELIKSTVPIFKEHGIPMTTHFYGRMMAHNPELKRFSTRATGLTGSLSRTGRKYRSLEIRPGQ